MPDITPRTEAQLRLIADEAVERAINTLLQLCSKGTHDIQLAAASKLLTYLAG